MSRTRIFILTTLAMTAFAGNSLLCRAALRETSLDPATFTLVRIGSGAAVLAVIGRVSAGKWLGTGSWLSAVALLAYAAGFSFAYLSLTAGTGALVLFGAVQATMISYGWWSGEKLRGRQGTGLLVAMAGLVGLLLPGLSAPPFLGCVLMAGAGIAWGVYSLRGRGTLDPLAATSGNFCRAVPLTGLLSVLCLPQFSWDAAGAAYALLSGGLASGVGYAVWYTALKGLRATEAASVQLSVPALAAFGGVLLLGEQLTPRLVLAALAILGGIGLILWNRQPAVRAAGREMAAVDLPSGKPP